MLFVKRFGEFRIARSAFGRNALVHFLRCCGMPPKMHCLIQELSSLAMMMASAISDSALALVHRHAAHALVGIRFAVTVVRHQDALARSTSLRSDNWFFASFNSSRSFLCSAKRAAATWMMLLRSSPCTVCAT